MCVRARSVARSCLTLCDPMNCSPLASSVHGILPFPTPGDLPCPGVEPVSPSLSGTSPPRKPQSDSYVLPFHSFLLSHFNRARLSMNSLWTVAHQPPLSMGFSNHHQNILGAYMGPTTGFHLQILFHMSFYYRIHEIQLKSAEYGLTEFRPEQWNQLSQGLGTEVRTQ